MSSSPSARTAPADVPNSQAPTLSALLHLGVVYVVWGSTYLAIRVCVREGGGFGPFTLGLTRVGVSGLILLTVAVLTRQRLQLTRRELGLLTISGLLMWICGNGFVMLAEKRIDSGFAAVIVASTPIWVALLEAIIDRRAPSAFLVMALAAGFGGVVVLSYPVLREGVQADVLSIAALIAAAIGWGGGSLLQARKRLDLSPLVSGGVQMMAGSVGFLLLAMLTHEHVPTPDANASLAWLYLVGAGAIAFVSYMTILRHLPISIVTTYAYVNPVIAVLLGWIILSEPITVWILAGSALVLVGVAGVFAARARTKPIVLPETS